MKVTEYRGGVLVCEVVTLDLYIPILHRARVGVCATVKEKVGG